MNKSTETTYKVRQRCKDFLMRTPGVAFTYEEIDTFLVKASGNINIRSANREMRKITNSGDVCFDSDFKKVREGVYMYSPAEIASGNIDRYLA